MEVDGDVTFCPCYLKLTIGNIGESTMHEIWNADALVELRRSFAVGVLPEPCSRELCPVSLAHHRGERPA